MKKETLDGNTAAAKAAYLLNKIAAIYPITPSSPMAEVCDEMASRGELNVFGTTMSVVEMQSEAGAAGALHGALAAGGFATTFTASQGLLLMIPNMYKISGELLPCVIHVTARALSTHALSIFGDHSDVMACRQTGFAMLSSNNVQEAHDFAIISQLVSLKTRVPFLHFFDGFRTSHEISNISTLTIDDAKYLLPYEKMAEFRARALNPEHPHQQGTAQNPDVFFQNREACNPYYNAVYKEFVKTCAEFKKLSGRGYAPFEYFGSKQAETVIVAMGSACEAIEETLTHYNKTGTKQAGLVKVRLYRPFDIAGFVKVLPASVKTVIALDRTKEPGSAGEPLYTDICTAMLESGKSGIKVLGGRYGLGSKEFNPAMIMAVLANTGVKAKNHFTVGINDDISKTSLAVPEFHLPDTGNTNCMFFGLGSDGTVSANKNACKIIGDNTNKYAQAYFVYDSKKSGSITISHLRFGSKPIKSTYEIEQADFLACHNSRYIGKYDLLAKLAPGGTFLLNTPWSIAELEQELPASLKRQIYNKKARFYTIDANVIAHELGLGGRINTIMQSAFFKLSKIMDYAKAKELMRDAAKKSYAKAGEKVLEQNYKAIALAGERLVAVKIPEAWKNAKDTIDTTVSDDYTPFCINNMKPIARLEGNKLPVSAFTADGRIPTDTTRFEKRGISSSIPEWKPENCIQCNFCSFVCPHAAIRPYLVTKNQKEKSAAVTLPATGKPGYEFRLQTSPLDCTGCGACVNVCPTKIKALEMNADTALFKTETENYNFYKNIDNPATTGITVKDSQFLKPYFEFNGACAGCGETPYIKLVSQLFGDRMIIANATGCTSIYGGSYPSCPYSTNKRGVGPAWASSLFEDNAEFGFGIKLALDARVKQLFGFAEKAIELKAKSSPELKEWMRTYENENENKIASAKLAAALETEINYPLLTKGYKTARNGTADGAAETILANRDLFVKKSVWCIGGDGWAYDIGYGGLDHVLAKGSDINILVLDTEVYSNTGGQASKATPAGSVVKFANGGKQSAKKSLALMAMAYPGVYVAQVAMGANMNQTLQALREAEAHKGPSIVIAYSTCIEQGIDMSNGNLQMRKAVACGYWNLFRYNPELAAQGKNPLILDSPPVTGDYKEYVLSERRFANLYKNNPKEADALIEKSKQDSIALLAKLKKLASE
ncbi:MAG: pyruvate:ferredoxin (flavodoxin) oxidoreductase [Firmicutes bacterium]|nr:pyruvate:ferredoxin (flavodoxin) oxidoreductase [Bacillota bacterium]